jgi:hypothetical protein
MSGVGAGIRALVPSSATLIVRNSSISDSMVGIHLENSGGYLFATVDNTSIQNMTGNGIETAGSWSFATVKRSTINHNGMNGVNAGSSLSTLTLVDSSVSMNSNYAVSASVAGARIRISGNTIVNSMVGLNIAAGAFIESDGTNRIAGYNASAAPNATFANQ